MGDLKKELKILDKIIVYSIVLIALLIFLGLLIQSANSDYHSFRQNKNYFKLNPEYKVQEWMNPQTILRHFNITEEQLFEILGVSNSETNFRTPLRDLCLKQKIDCDKVIEDVNLIIKQ
jgi:hypothetical protein